MADQKPPDQPPGEPSNRAESGMLPEQELDDILAKASALASDLSEQVGASQDGEPTSEASSTPLKDSAAHSDLEAELGELERLVAHTGKEFDTGEGDAIRPAPGSPNHAPGGGGTPPTSAAIPDFMEEFTRPETGAEEGTGSPERPAPSSRQKGIGERSAPQPAVGPEPDGLDSGSPRASGSSPEPAPRAARGAPQARRPAPPAAEAKCETPSPRKKKAHWLLTPMLKPMAAGLCGLVVTFLEIMDRPISGAGDGARRLIGWIAIATIGTAAIVYLYSLL